MSLDRIKAEYGPRGISDLPRTPALFSDDTQMSIAVAEALIEAGDGDLETIMDAGKNEFVKWRHSPENNRAPGNTCLAGVSNMERGVHWSESGIADSIACIAGGISGAYLGIDAISDDWIKRIAKSDFLDDLAVRLAEKVCGRLCVSVANQKWHLPNL